MTENKVARENNSWATREENLQCQDPQRGKGAQKWRGGYASVATSQLEDEDRDDDEEEVEEEDDEGLLCVGLTIR